MSRIDPHSREEAFVYQFEDDFRLLKVKSLHGESEFEDSLKMIEMHIKCYRSKKLKKDCDKAVSKHKEKMDWLEKHNPSLYHEMTKSYDI